MMWGEDADDTLTAWDMRVLLSAPLHPAVLGAPDGDDDWLASL